MEDRVKILEEENKEITARLSKLEGDRQLQAFQYDAIMKSIEEIKLDLKELKGTPSKRWDLIVTGTITAFVGGIIAFIVGKIFN